MLQIRLSNKAAPSETGAAAAAGVGAGAGGAKLPSGETVTVACPDHLVLAELPVAKSLGSANGVTLVKTLGRRSRRPLGERVHFCVQCDFPVAVYGRLVCSYYICLAYLTSCIVLGIVVGDCSWFYYLMVHVSVFSNLIDQNMEFVV